MNPETPNILPYLLEAVVGAAIGAFVAIAFSFVTKRRINFVPDLLLGAAGYLGGVAAVVRIPWHENTIVYRVGNTVVRSTTRHYQYPYRVAFVLAVLLPVLFEVISLMIRRRKPGSS